MKGEKSHILVMKYSSQLHHATVAFDAPEHRLEDETEVVSTEVLSVPFVVLSKFSKTAKNNQTRPH